MIGVKGKTLPIKSDIHILRCHRCQIGRNSKLDADALQTVTKDLPYGIEVTGQFVHIGCRRMSENTTEPGRKPAKKPKPEVVEQIPLSELHPFPDHPFQVRDDDAIQETAESIKPYEMIASAMESKRLGLCKKSPIVVSNHLTERWTTEFLQLYPAANILVATRKDFETKNRKKFCGRIAAGDYDTVIIGPPKPARRRCSERFAVVRCVF